MNTADALDKTANAADGMREYTENDCLWLRLAGEKLPVVLYGTGNGADKILDACIKYGIKNFLCKNSPKSTDNGS